MVRRLGKAIYELLLFTFDRLVVQAQQFHLLRRIGTYPERGSRLGKVRYLVTSAGGWPQKRRSPVEVGWIVIYSAVLSGALPASCKLGQRGTKPREVAGARGRVLTIRRLDKPIDNIEAVTVACLEEIGISDHEINLLLHWCGDLFVTSDFERG